MKLSTCATSWVTGLGNQIAPAEVENKIQHLLVVTNEMVLQTTKMLFADHQEFYKCFTEKDILHPVALLSDGHSSRFDYEVQSFLESKHICFFFTMPYTTGITQLLNWLNNNLHRKDKEIRIASLYLHRLLTRRLL